MVWVRLLRLPTALSVEPSGSSDGGAAGATCAPPAVLDAARLTPSPAQVPLYIVVGKPIPVPKVEQPSPEQVGT